jgi:cyclophilin family peptidyl-prolyl cis-trans isomerase
MQGHSISLFPARPARTLHCIARPARSLDLARAGIAVVFWALVIAPASLADHHEAAEAPVAFDYEAFFEPIDDYVANMGIAIDEENWRMMLPAPPLIEFEASKKYYWLLETSLGSLRFELYPDLAPNHVINTIYLSRLGFFDGLRFHRIVSGMIAQSGSSSGGKGGTPGYTFPGEFSKDPRQRHSKSGKLSMANGGPGTDGSEFFITFKKLRKLDGKHTVFGELVESDESLKVMKALSRAGGARGKPKKKIDIVSARLEVMPR